MQRPPDGVRMVIEAVCIMKGIKPKKVAGEKVSRSGLSRDRVSHTRSGLSGHGESYRVRLI